MDKQIAITLTFRDQASGAAAKAVGALSGAFKGLAVTGAATASTVTGAFGTMVGKVGGFVGGLVKSAQLASLFIGGSLVAAMTGAVDMAAKFERFGVAAEFLTGSASAAEEFAKSVRSISLATMFNVDQIAEMESRLIGNTKNVQLSDKALRALTEAVAATGGGYVELEGATRAWIQTNSKAKASSEELNRQFANANIPVIRALAESIEKDLNHPLRQYLSVANNAGGVSKKLATAFEGATEKTKYLGEEIRIAEAKLKGYEGNSKIAGTTVDSLKLSILKKKDALGQANATIGEYTTAQGKATKATNTAKLSVEGIMGQLQDLGDLNIPGTVMAEAITRAFEEAYGGANQRLIQTFSGQLSLLKDSLKLLTLSFLGLDKNFKIVEGGLFDMLTKGLRPVVEWLNKNQEAIGNFGAAIGKNMPALMAFGFFLFGVLSAALILILGKVLLLGAIFGGLGYAVGLVIEKLGGFQGVMDKARTVVEFATTKFEALQKWVKENEMALIIIASVLTTFFLPALINTAVVGIGTMLIKLAAWIIMSGVHAVAAVVSLTLATIRYGLAGWGAVFSIITQTINLGLLLIAKIAQIAVTIILTIATWAWAAASAAAAIAIFLLTTPIGLVILAIIALIAVGIWLMMHWDQVKATAQAVWAAITAWISQKVEEGRKFIVGVWEFIKKWLADTWAAIKAAAGSAWQGIADAIIGPIKNIIDWLGKAVDKAKELIGKAGELAKKGLKIAGLNFQHGGIVPGPVGAPVPIVAHGGERITPRGSNTNAPFANGGAGGGVTINFSGPVSMDSESRVQELADRIIRQLGRQNELSRYGVGF